MPSSPSYLPLHPNRSQHRFSLSARLACLAILTFPLGLLILSLLAYLDPSQSMRICLPFSLTRLSTSAHRTLSCQYVTNSSSIGGIMSGVASEDGLSGVNGESSGGRLGGFLLSQRELFMSDVREGKLKGWTIAMGNEAGDLDSLASAVAYSCLSSTLQANRSIPLALTPSSLMPLRPENLLAFELANVPISTLLHPDTLPVSSNELTNLGAQYALVDHNKLLLAYAGGTVDAVIDHHDDEGLYKDAAVRVMQVPCGSCAALVTKHFMPQWKASMSSPAGGKGSPVPPELATLLLSAIVIDTAGLSEGGKATTTDRDSAAFLYPLSSFASGDTAASLSTSSSAPDLEQIAEQLLTAKFEVSHLSTHDLLLRDYKEYVLPTSSSSYPSLRVGLSTVPQALKISLAKESSGWTSYLESIDGYMTERSLDIEGVLTSYKTEKKGKHKRELVLVIRTGGAISDLSAARKVLKSLSAGLEASDELQLGSWERKEFKRSVGKKDVLESERRVGNVWEQGNAKATRKQVAPLLRDLIAKL